MQENKKEKIQIFLYGLSIVLFLIGFLPIGEVLKIICYLLSVLLAGYDLLLEGIQNIIKLNLEESTLMTVAVIAAFALGQFQESCLVVLLFKLGEFLEEKAIEKSHKNIENIVKIKAENANKMENGRNIQIVKVEELKVGDTILIKPGEKVPVDSKILSGESTLDTSSLTGESVPKIVEQGEEILSGSINLMGVMECEVIRDSKNSTASQIVDLVYQATNNKGKTEKFMTKFSKIYTPIVMLLAIAIAVIPPAFGYLDFITWIKRGLIFLVASCPCSLVISVPLSFFSCVGAISKKGLIIKGTKHIENLAKANTIAFDKTGTLTTGEMTIDTIEIIGKMNKKQVISYLIALEKLSNHPIASSVLKIEEEKEELEVTEFQEIAGYGIKGKIEGKEVLLGNRKLLEKYQTNIEQELLEEAVYLCVNKEIQGYIILKEEIRKDCKSIVEDLRKVGVSKTVVLTGDNKKAAEKLTKELEMKEVYSGLLPQQKLEKINELKQENTVIFVGDGINDSPVLAASDFGISMAAGAELANNTADAILLSNKISTLPNTIKLAKKGMKIIKYNIAFSLLVKAVVLVLGATGKAPIWMAILADTGVTLLTVLNSLRILKG